MEIDKICRCCLALNGPLLSIYDGGSSDSGCVADMLKDIAKLKPQQNDNMPDKVCLSCISEINRCYVFKMKCENSNRTLRQLLPDAVKENFDDAFVTVVDQSDSGTQTDEKVTNSIMVQTVSTDVPIMVHTDVQTDEDFTEFFFKEELQQQPKSNLKRPLSVENSPKRRKQLNQNLIRICDDQIVQEAAKTAEKESDQSSTYILLESLNIDSTTSEEEYINQNAAKNEQQCNSGQQSPILEYIEEVDEEYMDEHPTNFSNTQECDFTCNLDNESFTVKDTDPDYNIEEQRNLSEDHEEEQEEKTKTTAPILQKRTPNQRREQYQCSFCIMTFVSLKVLRRHLSKRHDIADTELIVDEVPVLNETNNDTSQSQDSTSEKLELTTENVPNPKLLPRTRVRRKTEGEVHSKFKYFCEYCMAGFAQRKTLTYHMKQKICMSNNFKCNLCDRIFISEANLEMHKETHKNQYSCLECNKECGTIEQLSEHMIEEHNRNARNQCHICKKVFTMRASLIDHLRIHSGEKPFECTVCGKRFAQNSNLRQHLMRHTNEKNFKCDVCPNSYVTKAELFSHKRTHTGDHPFKCKICTATFTSSSSLLKHKRKHTGERPYECEFCPMRFAALNVLKNHQRTHTGEKPYKCSYCDKCFTQKGDCQLHQRTHVLGEVVCFCGSKFSKTANLRQHLKIKHPNMTDEKRKELDNAINKESLNDDGVKYRITLMSEDDSNEDNGDETIEFITVDNSDDNALTSQNNADDDGSICSISYICKNKW